MSETMQQVLLVQPVEICCDRCALCGATIPVNGPPLCPLCEEDQESKWRDYLDEQAQARRPF